MEIEGAVVLVTGASSGIGLATATAAAHAGARVALAARREERVRDAARALDGAMAVRLDVTDQEQVDAAVRAVLETHGRVDVLVNNAGQGLQASVEDTDPEDFRALLDLDLVAPLRMMRAVLPSMRQQGSGAIVNVSSGTTFADAPGTGAYVAAKTGLERLSAIARAELADAGVAVSTMIPFLTGTEFITSIRAGRDEAERSTTGVQPDPPERVATAILDLVRSGDARADLVPAEYGGSRR